MSVPVRRRLSMICGEDVTFRITVTDLTGSTLNLSGWDDIQFNMWNPSTGSTLVSKSLASTTIALVTPQSTESNRGRADISVDSADTLNVAAGVYRYDVLGIDASSLRDELIHPSDFVLEAGG